MKRFLTLALLASLSLLASCKEADKKNKEVKDTTSTWEVDFLDEFETFNPENWQDQRIWVNNENFLKVMSFSRRVFLIFGNSTNCISLV